MASRWPPDRVECLAVAPAARPYFRGHRVRNATATPSGSADVLVRKRPEHVPLRNTGFFLRVFHPHPAARLPRSKNTPPHAANMECESHAFAGIARAMPERRDATTC